MATYTITETREWGGSMALTEFKTISKGSKELQFIVVWSSWDIYVDENSPYLNLKNRFQVFKFYNIGLY